MLLENGFYVKFHYFLHSAYSDILFLTLAAMVIVTSTVLSSGQYPNPICSSS
ncbi:hypothetical protein BACI349Y_490010 [Bacillus sp. 349Y]|nr:hypothetical protein BACI349Y_490010 [Bacillus sp. 349Y]